MSTPETPATGASEQEAPVCYRHTDREAHIRCQRCDRPDLPGLHAPGGGRLPVPVVRPGGRPVDPVRPDGVRRQAHRQPGADLAGADRAQRRGLAADPGHRRRGAAGSSTCSRCCPTSAFTLVNGSPELIRGVADGAPWQLLTSMFTHVEIWHIGFNMLALWTLGPQLELAIGRARFLALYLLSGLAGSATVLWFSDAEQPDPRRLGRDLRPDGRAARGRGQGRAATSAACSTWIGINFVITFVLGAADLLAGPPRRLRRRRAARRRDRLRPPGAPDHAGRSPGSRWSPLVVLVATGDPIALLG